MPMPNCSAVTGRGYQCINPAQAGKVVCATHDPTKQCGAPTVSGTKCKRSKMRGHDRCSKHT